MSQSLLDLLLFFHDALLVSLMIGAVLGPVGLFLHLRRSLFLGAALPQLAGFGFVLANVLGIPEWISAGIILLFFALFSARKRTSAFHGMTMEANIGLWYVMALAGTMLLLALTKAEGHAAELLLKGSVLAASCTGTRILAAVGIPLLIMLYVVRRRFYFISLDPETALTMGISVANYDALLFMSLGVAITFTLSEAGAMACFALLLIPTLCALALCRRVASMFAVSLMTGALGGFFGVVLALVFDLPAGPSIVVVLFVLWLISLFVRFFRR